MGLIALNRQKSLIDDPLTIANSSPNHQVKIPANPKIVYSPITPGTIALSGVVPSAPSDSLWPLFLCFRIHRAREKKVPISSSEIVKMVENHDLSSVRQTRTMEPANKVTLNQKAPQDKRASERPTDPIPLFSAIYDSLHCIWLISSIRGSGATHLPFI